MLYKVTPRIEPEVKAPKAKKDEKPRRKRRNSTVYDAEGCEVLISLMCLKCRQVKPLAQFGLRKMSDGALRNQPWCRPCRTGSSTKVGLKGRRTRKETGLKYPSPNAQAAAASTVAESAVPSSEGPSAPAAQRHDADVVHASVTAAPLGASVSFAEVAGGQAATGEPRSETGPAAADAPAARGGLDEGSSSDGASSWSPSDLW